jgi:hypothetical protein
LGDLRRFARTGRALAATALVEQDDAVPLRIKNRVNGLWLPAPGPPCMTIIGSPASVPDGVEPAR